MDRKYTEAAAVETTMRDLVELTWLRYWEQQKNGEGSKRRALMVLEDLEWIDLSPVEITRKSLLQLVDFYLQKDNSNATVNRKIAAITKLLGTAFDEELINRKPTIRFLTERNARTRFITLSEEEALLYWLRELGYVGECHLTIFLLDTGCRVGEALKLRPEHVDRQRKCVLFGDTKNGTTRMIPLTDRALDSVLKWGEVKSVSVFDQKFKRAREHAGLGNDVTPHVMRHTNASRLAQSGVSVVILKAWLGHKTIRMTDRYAHLDTSSLQVAKDVLEQFSKK
ncbi:Tyrosine recombinase XerD [compost metagenome]